MPDYFSAYGQYGKEVLTRHGSFPAEKVWIGGAPRFDRVLRKQTDRVDARARHGLPSDKFIILVATETFELSGGIVRVLLEFCRDIDEVLVCVKLHPGDRFMDRYVAMARRFRAKNVRFYRAHFNDLLAASDVLIGAASTTLLEAILTGKATICANFTNEPDRYPYVADGGSLGAGSPEQLRMALERVRRAEDDPRLARSRREFLRRHLGPTATGRGAATMASLIARHFLEAEVLARSA